MELSVRWPLGVGAELRDALLAAYGDPRRRYHDLRHLSEVLDRLDELAAAGVPFDDGPVRLAAWFHDAVYDGPGAEERSATWAERALPTLVGAEATRAVARLVRLTVAHEAAADDPDGAALCDADLGILAADPGRYAAYTADVRAEYAHLDGASFRRGRAEVLTRLVQRPWLFGTAYARTHWEPAARRNLGAELAGLAADPEADASTSPQAMQPRAE